MDSLINNSIEPLFTLQIAAKLSKTSVYSIRKYIDKGLIIPYRKESNRCLFSKVDIIRLKNIREYLDTHGLNIAGIKAVYSQIPCWKIKPCSLSERLNCEAYHSLSKPCWEASKKSNKCKNEDCRQCNVYGWVEDEFNIKSLVKKLIH